METKTHQIKLTERDYSIMTRELEPNDGKNKRDKERNSVEMEDAIIRLHAAVEFIGHNLNVLISEYSGEDCPKSTI